MKKSLGLAMASLVMFCTGASNAANTGRYQAIALENEGQARGGSRVFIIDTQEGHIWTWSGNDLVSEGGNERRYGPAFVYYGKVRPGSRVGEVMERLPK